MPNQEKKKKDMEKFICGILCPFLFWAIFLGFLIFLLIKGWEVFEPLCVEHFGYAELLDISVYAQMCYYEFGAILFACSIIAYPMLKFRLKLLRKFGVSKIKTNVMFGMWIFSMLAFQLMAWTNVVQQGTHFLSALAGFASLVAALMFDQIMVCKMPRSTEYAAENSTGAKISIFLLLSAILQWLTWIMCGLTILEWTGVVFIITTILIWIPQNLNFYANEPEEEKLHVETLIKIQTDEQICKDQSLSNLIKIQTDEQNEIKICEEQNLSNEANICCFSKQKFKAIKIYCLRAQ